MKKKYHLSVALVAALLSSSAVSAAVIQEDFTKSPGQHGWQIFGDTSLFEWNSASGALNVTWDSSKPNAYFHLPLGFVLTRSDDFSVSFDLRLSDFIAGVDPAKPNPFQIAAGFLNEAQASSSQFFRGSGFNSPDLVEFSFFPDPGGAWMWGPSVTGAMVDASGNIWATGFGPFGLQTEEVYHVSQVYHSASNTLTTAVLLNGQSVGEVSLATLGATFKDFAVDQFAICSYSDAGQDPAYAGSLLAHGTVDNIEVTIPDRMKGEFVSEGYQVQFWTKTNWLYTLERSTDLKTWDPISAGTPGNGVKITWLDSTPPAERGFYRISSRVQ